MLTGGGLRGRDGVEDERDSVEAFESGCANEAEVGERMLGRGCPCGGGRRQAGTRNVSLQN
jgi:hypothetical protein